MTRMRVETATVPTILRGDETSAANPCGPDVAVGLAVGSAAISVGWRRAASVVGVGMTDSKEVEVDICEEEREVVEAGTTELAVVGGT